MNRSQFLLIALLLFVINSSITSLLINNVHAATSNYYTPEFQHKLKNLVSRRNSTTKTLKIALISLPPNITPLMVYTEHPDQVFKLAEGHAYPVLLTLHELGLDLKKIDKQNNSRLSNIIKKNKAVDLVYAQGSDIAQLEIILATKKYTQNEIERARYSNSIFEITIESPGSPPSVKLYSGSSAWAILSQKLTAQQQKKYTQWMRVPGRNGRVHVHFRNDGVLGLATSDYQPIITKFNYDTGITWSMDGKNMYIHWNDGIKFKFKYDKTSWQRYIRSATAGWTVALEPLWSIKAKNKQRVVSIVSKGEPYAEKSKIKAPLEKNLKLTKKLTAISKKQLLGVWQAVKPKERTKEIAYLNFYESGFLAPWYEFPDKKINSIESLFRNNGMPKFEFGNIVNHWQNINNVQAVLDSNTHQSFSYTATDIPGSRGKGYTKKIFDDWQLLENNLIRISRRFYQAKINGDKLTLTIYAVCQTNQKTTTDCFKNKIILKQNNNKNINWQFKRLNKTKLQKFNTYTTIELLKVLPDPKSGLFKVKTKLQTPNYRALLQSSKQLALQKIPGYMIIDSLIPYTRNIEKGVPVRAVKHLQYALQQGFGRWLLEIKFVDKPICFNYIRMLKRTRLKLQEKAREVLKKYCSNPDLKKFKSTNATKSSKNTATAAIKPNTKTVPIKVNKTKKPVTITKVIPDIDALSGCWKWSNGPTIIITKDGQVKNGVIPAKWKTIDSKNNRYSITWPSITDTVTLSVDGSSYSGLNIFGMPVSGKRISGKLNSIQGKWLSNNIELTLAPNKTATAGPLKGIWKKLGNGYVIEWPIIDNITVAKNKNTLTGKNQFGSFSAKRDIHCDTK